MLKFPVGGGVVTIRSTILIPAECATVVTLSKDIPKEAGVCHENFKIAPHPNFPDQEVAIGGTLSTKGRTNLCSLLKKNLDIFAWQPSDMTGGQAPDRAKAIQAEVQKLVEARIMREVFYHEWLSNPVMVKKYDGSWRMCVDFTDLNKACPQDCYPLPKIDWKVESLCGYPFKCFLDAYKGYHQIQMAESDEEKMAFHTSQGIYCYTKIAFGLKNAGATYQRLVEKAFDNQVGRNIEVYVDDLVIKSYTKAEMIRDIKETFRTLLKINTKLNPKKWPRTKLYPNEKASSITGFCHQEAAEPRTSVKGQILADFLVEKPNENPPDTSVVETPQEPWTLFTDGSSCVDGSGAGLILTSPEGTGFTYALRFQFTASNNEAEYEALIAGLQIAAQMGVRNVQVSVDSKLVANKILRTYVAKEENMVKYLEKAKSLISGFANFSISQVPRSKNKKADALSKIASTSFAHLSKQVLVEILKEKSIQEKEVEAIVEEEGLIWMTPIIEYLKDGTLPGDRKEASKLRIKARQYELLEVVLYRRSFLKPWLSCVGPLQADYVIREIHEGSCSMHAGPRSVVAKAMRLGYYWPTMHRDARDMIRACNYCQIHRPVPRNAQQPLTPITAPWPFYKWGIDIAGPFPEGPGKVKFFIVAMDYFTKWIEAKAVATITGKSGEEIRVGQHCMPLRSPKRNSLGQWVRGVTFRPGDFVYHSNDASHVVAGGKLGPKWEGPYEVTEALGDGAYRLRSIDGAVLPRT
ncbi:reverse transcriptase domain-containing protein [Tanacetum coccineum]